MAEGKGGSSLRLVILLVIMGLLGGALGYDMYNEVPFKQMESDVEKLLALGSKNKEGAATRTDVEAALNKKAATSYKTETGKYEVVHYNYSRTIPFIPGGKVYVVYDNAGKYIRTGLVTNSEKITEKSLQGTLDSKQLDPNAMPSMSLGGQTSTPIIPDTKKDEKKDENAGDAKEGDAKEGDKKEGDAKEGDAKEGDAKEGDAKEGDKKEGGGL